MGNGISLQCIKTKRYYYIDESFKDYLNKIMSILDLERQFEDFMVEDIGFCDCMDICWLLSDHIDSNKIFEMVDKHNDPIPVIIDDNINMPSHCRPLPLDKLNQFGELLNFLKEARRGITVK